MLDELGPPVYVRGEIVHNTHVVSWLAEKGAVFVDDPREVPVGQTIILSAHGVSPEVRRIAAERDLRVIDATCPLVAKVHAEVRRFAGRGRPCCWWATPTTTRSSAPGARRPTP